MRVHRSVIFTHCNGTAKRTSDMGTDSYVMVVISNVNKQTMGRALFFSTITMLYAPF